MAQTYCIPSYSGGTSNGDFIEGLSVGSIYNMALNAAGAPSYIDTNSALSTSLTSGVYYTLTLFSGTRTTHNTFAVFIDYNGDGDFFDTDESVIQFPEVNYPNYPMIYNFQVPTSVGNYVSRMRIVEVYDTTSSLLIRPCDNYQYGQTQDIKINLTSTIQYAACSGTDTITNCHGTLTDGSGPTANYLNNQDCKWLIRAPAGNKISINVSNVNIESFNDALYIYDGQNFGSASLGLFSGTTGGTVTSTGNYVLVYFHSNSSITGGGFNLIYNCIEPAYCSVLTNGCGANYISNTTISETGLNFSSSCDTANSAYSNYPNYAILEKGRTYSLTVTETIGSFGGPASAWIDYNMNHSFEPNEWITGPTFTVPAWAFSGATKLRVRAGDDLSANPANSTPCYVYYNGETEDYGILIKQAASDVPLADFSAAFTTLTVGEGNNFTDLSTNFPSSFKWSFPGAVPSSSTSPTPKNIIYPTVGCYPVTLIAYNGMGSDTITKTCYINVVAPGTNYCNPNPYYGVGNSFINGVHLNSLSNLNTGNNNGSVYTFYANPVADVALSINSILTIYTGPDNSDYYAAWIDYNNDNDFNDINEKLGQVTNVQANSSASLTFVVPSGTSFGNKRMRIRNAHTANSGSIIDPCTGYYFGETEDYLANIITAFPAPVADFSASATSISANSSVNFTDLTSNAPTSWAWTFTGGTPSTSTVQNPTNILYSTPGCYPVQLIAISVNGGDTLKRTCYIDVAPVAPVADFVANTTTFLLNGSANFTDQSSNLPTSWEWTFYGASPSTSTNQNPTNIAYNGVNCYDVKLKVSNSAGVDSITKTCFINVVSSASPCTELFFSEYLEGASNDKALEIYNPDTTAVNLNGYAVEVYSNGGTTPTVTYNMTGTLAAHGVFVLANSGSNATILAIADATSGVCNFNGNDALVLKKNGIILDVIGEVGVNPGLNWAVGTGSTQDHTLTRKITVALPEANWATSQSQWNSYSIGTTTYLGAYTSNCSISSSAPNAAFTVSNPTCVDLPTLFTNTSSNATSYLWTFNGTTPSTSSLASPAATWLSSGIYQVTLIASNSIYSDTLTETVTINDNPALPVITQNGNTLQSTPALTYEWYLANVFIPGATSQNYNPTQNGQYRVKVTNASGCWTTSLNFNYSTVGINENTKNSAEIKIIPNPFSSSIALLVTTALHGKEYKIIDKLGRVLKRGTITETRNEIELNEFAQGIYLLLMNNQSFKLVKQ